MKKGIWKIWLILTVCLALVGPTLAGQIVAWGSNNSGQRDVPAGDDFVSIAAGAFHGLALKSDGSLVAWGNNDAGRSEVPEGDDFLDITAGSGHNLVLKSDGSLAAWGYNYSGQCDVAAGNDFVAIAAGWYHSLAIKSDGSLAAWGYNYYGQCNVPAGNDFVDVAAGFGQSLAIKSDGSLVAWGSDHFDLNIVPKGNDFIAVASGFTHNLALRSDGSLVAWGYNYSGQCNVPAGNAFVAIAANDDYCLALRSDGSLRAWGYNTSGRCNVPTGNSFTAIATGKYHGIALESEPVTLVGIEIVGPDEVGENYHSQYKAVAYYEDGSTRNATNPAMWWVEPEAIATIESGLLQTKDVGQLQYITIYTTYTEGEVAVESEMTIQVYPSRTFYVPTDYETIQAAIDAARDVDRVLVADGTYTGPGNRDIDFLGKAITVISENGPNNCIIDCNGTEDDPHRGFHFLNKEDENSILAGFTIINGYTSNGSGIYCDDSSPTITNCNIIGNSVVGNGDNTGFGGGICSYYSSPTIANCTISGNSANWDGGGMFNYSDNLTLTNCTFSGNSAGGDGGGMLTSDGSPTLTNCTFSGNSAGKAGGGMLTSDGSVTLTNCTFSGNSAPSGNAIACDSYYDQSSTIQLTNCILANGGDEIWNNDSSTITITYSDVQGGWLGDGNIDEDPCFVDPCDGDYRLLPISPCIDAGDNMAVPPDTADLDGDGNTTEPIPFDLDGNPRIVDGNDDGNSVVDMGAYEYEAMVSCFGVNHVKLETKAGKKGNKVELKGTFSPALPIDFAVDDVAYIIDDGQGNALVFLIPAGSFKVDGKPDKQKFKSDSPKGSQPDIKARFDFDKCKFELKAKRVQGTDEITSTTLTIELWAGANVAQEVVQVQVKPKHLEFKREPKLSCCPKCKGIALLEVTSDQGVFVFEPDPGKEKLKRKTVVDDGVNGRVKIDTSCSKTLEVGDVFGVYTVTDLIKIFDDCPDDD